MRTQQLNLNSEKDKSASCATWKQSSWHCHGIDKSADSASHPQRKPLQDITNSFWVTCPHTPLDQYCTLQCSLILLHSIHGEAPRC